MFFDIVESKSAANHHEPNKYLNIFIGLYLNSWFTLKSI